MLARLSDGTDVNYLQHLSTTTMLDGTINNKNVQTMILPQLRAPDMTSYPHNVPPVAASPQRNEPPVDMQSPRNVPPSPGQSHVV